MAWRRAWSCAAIAINRVSFTGRADGPLVVNPGSLGQRGFQVTRGDHPHRAEACPHARHAIIHATEGTNPMAGLISFEFNQESVARRAEAVGPPLT